LFFIALKVFYFLGEDQLFINLELLKSEEPQFNQVICMKCTIEMLECCVRVKEEQV